MNQGRRHTGQTGLSWTVPLPLFLSTTVLSVPRPRRGQVGVLGPRGTDKVGGSRDEGSLDGGWGRERDRGLVSFDTHGPTVSREAGGSRLCPGSGPTSVRGVGVGLESRSFVPPERGTGGNSSNRGTRRTRVVSGFSQGWRPFSSLSSITLEGSGPSVVQAEALQKDPNRPRGTSTCPVPSFRDQVPSGSEGWTPDFHGPGSGRGWRRSSTPERGPSLESVRRTG